MRVFTLFCFLLSWHATLWAFSSGDSGCVESVHVGVYEDQDGTHSLEDVRDRAFETLDSGRFTLGYGRSTWWFEIQARNGSAQTRECILAYTEALAGRFDLYTQTDGVWKAHENGLRIPLASRELRDPVPAFSLRFAPGETKTLYVRLESPYPVFGAIETLTPDAFENGRRLFHGAHLLYFGAALALALYNLFLYVAFREKLHLYYVAYVSAFTYWVWLLSGQSLFFLSGGAHEYVYFACHIWAAFLLLFSRTFMETRTRYPKIDRLLRGSVLLIVLIAGFHFWDSTLGFLGFNLVALYLFPVLLWLALSGVTQGVSASRIYFCALLFYYAALILLALMSIGILEYNLLTRFGFLLGSLMEILLFSYAIAHRNLHQKKAAIRAERLGREELEQHVDERTHALNAANDKLQHSLKERDALIRELHHRVKNNLQSVIGMLWLGFDRLKDPLAQQALKESQERIKAMALAHDLLYRAENFSRIDLRDYVERLSEATHRTYRKPGVRLSTDLASAPIDMERAIAFGLICTEALSNAFKHGFVGKEEGEILIALRREGSRLVFEICNDGAALVPDCTSGEGVGWPLIKGMAKKFKEADLSLVDREGGGVRFALAFTYEETS